MSSSESDEFEVIDQLEASLLPEELAQVQSSKYHRHLSSQAPETGLWICETSKYQQWQDASEHGTLWIKGVPGAGKSPLITCPLDDFSDERLWEHLLAGLSSINKAYCVLLMTSRPKQYLQSTLRDASIVHISLEDDLVGEDISLFLSYRLKTLLPHDENHELRSSLVSAISERSSLA
ncbi:hypothetical protein NA56DRAFT_673429 [Hyaloscypha hepaticicola]|uniref:Nephrocystin 3-like N-terminal domain-containing protein n=1 Tax=Hyaloscypha hepaticicola TaxID=2082293 RepID=A0A2J6PQH4_9HELO|nr:hypothetical protein NA56DRAFT_673429 [Hyaloscypha hepaticicola]